jgi:tetratricopeptide (TPR) repeat protein
MKSQISTCYDIVVNGNINDESVDINDNNGYYYHSIALYNLLTDQIVMAIYFLKLAIKCNYVPSNYELGNALYKIGKIDESKTFYLKAIEKNTYIQW